MKYNRYLPLYITFPGSIITTIGITVGKSKTAMLALFKKLKQASVTLSVDGITEWVIKEWGLPDNFKDQLYSHAVLVEDIEGRFTPLVTNWMWQQLDNDTSYIAILPLSPDTTLYGVLAYADNEEFQNRIRYTFLDEDEDAEEEE